MVTDNGKGGDGQVSLMVQARRFVRRRYHTKGARGLVVPLVGAVVFVTVGVLLDAFAPEGRWWMYARSVPALGGGVCLAVAVGVLGLFWTDVRRRTKPDGWEPWKNRLSVRQRAAACVLGFSVAALLSMASAGTWAYTLGACVMVCYVLSCVQWAWPTRAESDRMELGIRDERDGRARVGVARTFDNAVSAARKRRRRGRW